MNKDRRQRLLDKIQEKVDLLTQLNSNIAGYDFGDAPQAYRDNMQDSIYQLMYEETELRSCANEWKKTLANNFNEKNTITEAFQATINSFENFQNSVLNQQNTSPYIKTLITDATKKVSNKVIAFANNYACVVFNVDNNCFTKLCFEAVKFYSTALDLILDIKKPCETTLDSLRIFSLACALRQNYLNVNNFVELFINKRKDFLNLLDEQTNCLLNNSIGCKTDSHINKNEINAVRTKKGNNFERCKLVLEEIINHRSIVEIEYISSEILKTELLPFPLQTEVLSARVVSYFENRRVDTLKEAINLCFSEVKQDELAKNNDAKTQELLRKQEAAFANEYKTLKETSDAQYRAVAAEQDKLSKAYSNVADEHNKLVDEHNKLIDELKK